jgi:hypothetical protein
MSRSKEILFFLLCTVDKKENVISVIIHEKLIWA